MYTWSLTNYLNISGDQLGSYFGYALATSDVDGDLKDDLIIGAPLHAEKNNEKKYEVGRVTIAYQGINVSLKCDLANLFYLFVLGKIYQKDSFARIQF